MNIAPYSNEGMLLSEPLFDASEFDWKTLVMIFTVRTITCSRVRSNAHHFFCALQNFAAFPYQYCTIIPESKADPSTPDEEG